MGERYPVIPTLSFYLINLDENLFDLRNTKIK